MKKFLSFVVCSALLIGGLTLGLADNAVAGETEVHGYGFQGYLKSSKNNYLDAKEGTYNFNEIAVLFSNKVEDKTTVWIQLFGNSDKFGLDWAFVDYRLSNELTARAGQAKFPIGLINEIRDNKILHLSMMEAIMYREESDIIFEAYRGVGATYAAGPVAVDIFGGAPVLESEVATQKNEVKKLGGGRLTYMPLEGLKLMGSFAGFKEEVIDTTTGADVFPEGKERIVVGSASFEHGGIEINAEYAKKKNIEGDLLSYYAEAGYHFFEKLTPYVRYDYIRRADDGIDKTDPSNYQKEYVFGVGYKINPYFAVKVEEHWIEGYLLPIVTEEAEAGLGEKKWNMLSAGINFMF